MSPGLCCRRSLEPDLSSSSVGRACARAPGCPRRGIGQHDVLQRVEARHQIERLEHDTDRVAPVPVSSAPLQPDDLEVTEADRFPTSA